MSYLQFCACVRNALPVDFYLELFPPSLSILPPSFSLFPLPLLPLPPSLFPLHPILPLLSLLPLPMSSRVLSMATGKTDQSAAGVAYDALVNQLLTLMDGLNEVHNILVVGLTNRRELLDPALLRPGRYTTHPAVGCGH